MSGGRWNYNQCNLGYEMYPNSTIDYGLGWYDYERSVKAARAHNPMQDRQISELVFDVLCLIYSCDWYESGDTSEEQYLKDLRFFKEKWLRTKPENVIKAEIEKTFDEAKEELYQSFGLTEKVKE